MFKILTILMMLLLLPFLPLSLSAKKPINTDIIVDPPIIVEQIVKTGTTLTIHYDHPDLFNNIVVAVAHTGDYADALTQLYVSIDEDGDGIIHIYGLERASKYYITLIALDKSLDLYLY